MIDVISRMIVGSKSTTTCAPAWSPAPMGWPSGRAGAGASDLTGHIHDTGAGSQYKWVDWCNNRRLRTELGGIPPAEH
ncbi:hypothetical protein NSA53_12975 [Cellulosimicrobium cellulans]|uniref:hypothetical protein n=1 Tax=Cellulosimicrobium cellulans TaxID=1710 RepID=UPI002149A4D1|nr:hypothetical protein [Cellulosimicrobium cellulans]